MGAQEETQIADQIRSIGVPVLWMDIKHRMFSLNNYAQVLNQVSEFRPTAVQAWMYHANLFSLWLGHRLKIPVVWNVRHSLHDLKTDKWLTRRIIQLNAMLSSRPESIVYNSLSSSRQHERHGFNGEKAFILPNGFDMTRFHPSEEDRRVQRISLGVREDEILIANVARYHPTKGHEVLLAAAERLLRDGYQNVKFVLVGKGVDSDNKELMDVIRRTGLEGNALLLGERADVSTLTNAFDIATSTSYSEAFSNTIGEAMACGVPCVVTDVGDSAAIVGDTGLVVSPGDSDQFYAALKKLIGMSFENRKSLGKAAREKIDREYSIEHISHEYQKLYLHMTGA